jgi:hypothetical protein
MERTLFHSSSHLFGEAAQGAVITLNPGTQNAQGSGVYCSLGSPDVRASDSVYAHGLKTMFVLTVADSKKYWYQSKGCRDRKKSRPQTWHTKGASLQVIVEAVSTVTDSFGTYLKVEGKAARV